MACTHAQVTAYIIGGRIGFSQEVGRVPSSVNLYLQDTYLKEVDGVAVAPANQYPAWLTDAGNVEASQALQVGAGVNDHLLLVTYDLPSASLSSTAVYTIAHSISTEEDGSDAIEVTFCLIMHEASVS